MRYTLFILLLLNFSAFGQDLLPPPNVILPDPAPVRKPELWSHCKCGRDAHYEGGTKALSQFINSRISFPVDMKWGNAQRFKAYVEFVVEEDGSLSEIQIIRTDFPAANESIIEVFQSMTDWIGAKYGCGAARTYVRVPISLVVK